MVRLLGLQPGNEGSIPSTPTIPEDAKQCNNCDSWHTTRAVYTRGIWWWICQSCGSRTHLGGRWSLGL